MALPLKEIVNVQLGVSSGGPGIQKEIPVRGLTLNKYFWEMRVTDTDKLYPIFNPTNANDRVVYWSEDSDGKVVTVDANGNVVGIAIGTANVTCITEDGAYRSTCLYNILRALIPITSITLDKNAVTLEEGQSTTLVATALPANADDKTINWRSTDNSIATVTENGTVVAVKAGTASIYASAAVGNAESDPCVVTVTPPVIHVTNVQLDINNIQMEVGKTQQLTATVIPTNATNKSVTWKSSAPSVATVSSTGLVTCIAAGNATITVTTVDGGYSTTCAVKVVVPVIAVTGVSIDNGETADMDVGDTLQLTATVTPANATDKTVVWDTTNADILTVSAAGLVTAVSNGSAAITVTTNDGGFTDSITVSVAVPHVPVTGVTIDEGETGQVVKGGTTQLHATVLPSNASVKDVTWESSDIFTATVDSNGLVSGIAFGDATITVKTVEGGFTDTIVMTVPSAGTLTTDSIPNVLVGNTVQLTYTTNPPNAPLTDIVYTSSDPAIASVDENGLITVHTTGAPSITMTAKWYGETVSDSSGLNNSYELSVATDSVPDLTVGSTQQLVVTVTPDWVKTDPDYVIEYTTTDATVATISNTGLITGVADGGCRVGAKVTVKNATASDSSYQTVNAA